MEQSSIAQYLIKKGFSNVFHSTNPHILSLVKITNEEAKMIFILDADVSEQVLSRNILDMDKLYQDIQDSKQGVTMDMMTLVLGSHNSDALKLCKARRNCWYLDKMDQKIYLYDSQISDFCGLRYGLERWIEENGVIFPSEITKDFVKPYSIPAIVISVLCIIVVFLIYLGILDSTLCMLDAESLFQKQEWYRLFSSAFTHVEINHLMMNLLMLNVIATYAENYYGKAWMIAGYLLSAVTGGLLSMSYSLYSGNLYSSLGASGAIYGLIGMVLFQIMINWRKFNANFFRRLIMAVLLIIIGAVYSNGVDHMAHIGGFLGGYIFGIIVTGIRYWFSKKRNVDEQKK